MIKSLKHLLRLFDFWFSRNLSFHCLRSRAQTCCGHPVRAPLLPPRLPLPPEPRIPPGPFNESRLLFSSASFENYEKLLSLSVSVIVVQDNINKTGVINDPLGQPTVPAGSDHYFHTECPSVPNSNSSDNHCRPGLWAGRVDH